MSRAYGGRRRTSVRGADLFAVSAEVGSRVPLIASVESAESLWNVGDIAGWRGEGCQMSGLLVRRSFCSPSSILSCDLLLPLDLAP